MPRGYDAKSVPKITWEYWGIVEFIDKEILDVGVIYGLDATRADCHDRLCKHYGLSKESTKQITDNLDKLPDAVMLHHKLQEIQCITT